MDKIERIKELVGILNDASDIYYNTDKTKMSDFEFDGLFDELKSFIVKIPSKRIKDISSLTFNKLLVLGYIGNNKDNKSLWLCICSCKSRTLKICGGSEMSRGKLQSCGCLRIDRGKERRIDDSLLRNHHNRVYRIWQGMHSRCYGVNGKDYVHYGGRGIKICDEWLSDFMEFYQWSAHNGYKDNLTIDRIDVDGNYCAENCRWVTTAIQNKNKTTAIKVIYNNKEWILKDLVDFKNLTKDYKTIKQRILLYNISVEDAIITPIERKNQKTIFIAALNKEFKNKVNNLISKDDFCEKYNVNKNSVYDWLKRTDIKELLSHLQIKINNKGDLYNEKN
jgi:hypothetical protein